MDRIDFVNFHDISSKYYLRLEDVLNNCDEFRIIAYYLFFLPDNIKNYKLEIEVYFYDKEFDFPENWRIKKLTFVSSDILPKFPKSFICENIIISDEQKLK